MKSKKKKSIAALFLLLLFSVNLSVHSQSIKNPVTNTFQVSGNCGMCKQTIETAANKKGIARADWNTDTKMLSLTYNKQKTNASEILKRIAYAGYDNDQFYAPDEAYLKLPDCCKYKRAKKEHVMSHHKNEKESMHHMNMEQKKENPLDIIYSLYFEVKNALTIDDAQLASIKSKELAVELNKVKMESLGGGEHMAFMKYLSDLKTDAGHIDESKDLTHQRDHFTTLSANLYELMKAVKPVYPVYLDHCPMYNDGKGANWISKEINIKNPYYGSKMPTCGKVQETLK